MTMKKYPNEIKITNFSPYANAHRNLNREPVDELFLKAEKLMIKSRNRDLNLPYKERKQLIKEARRLDYQARQMWREIVEHAETL